MKKTSLALILASLVTLPAANAGIIKRFKEACVQFLILRPSEATATQPQKELTETFEAPAATQLAAPVTTPKAVDWHDAAQARSLEELTQTLSQDDKNAEAFKMVQAMSQDSFNTPRGGTVSYFGNPWKLGSYQKTDLLYLLIEVLKQGVTSFERVAQASPEYGWNDGGYDIVGYRIVHSDGTRSQVVAYRQNVNKNPFASMLGASDLRPCLNMIFVSQGAQKADKVYAAMMGPPEMSGASLVDRAWAEGDLKTKILEFSDDR